MIKTNTIVALLTEAGCYPEDIEELVNGISEATQGKEVLVVGIAVAIYLKILAQNLCDDNDVDTNLAVLLNLTDAYNVDVRNK